MSSPSSPSFPSTSLPQPLPRSSDPTSTQASSSSAIWPHIKGILSPGDFVGEGLPLLGEVLRLVLNPEQAHVTGHQDFAREFEVVRELGTGSYSIVYLVREALSLSPPSEDDPVHLGGRLELGDAASMSPPTEHGREYAIKLLSKADLDEEEFIAQLTKATIHQSLPIRSTIVTLHRTLETSAFLLLVLEFVPGQDLFYFLDNHYDVDPTTDLVLTPTPPTLGLLLSLHPSQSLSFARLPLIASMFGQMCEAVATCHDVSVFHRDIKPENFIITDGWIFDQGGLLERNVVVKLSDFGLSTRDDVSSDMDCGSAPYMSYECRNNLAPIYNPRGADVWSLGIVLINMIYHVNPWMDTIKDGCPSFDRYLSNPIDFFMWRFTGMTFPVVNFLVEYVFCILDDPTDDSQRISAHEFGTWVRDLPTLLGASQLATHTHSCVPSAASIATGHALTSAPASRHPSSRQASIAGGSPCRPPVTLQFLTRDASRRPVVDHSDSDDAVLSALGIVLDEEDEDEYQHKRLQHAEQQTSQEQQDQQYETELCRPPSPSVWPISNPKRRKRGRKGKGVTPSLDQIQTIELLASASQSLVRELCRLSSASASFQSFPDLPPPPPVPVPTSIPTVTKKPSRWRPSFGKSAGETTLSTRSDSHPNWNPGSVRAANVSNLIMELSLPSISSQTISLSPLLSPSPPETTGQGRGEQRQQQSLVMSPTSIGSGRRVANVSARGVSSNWRNPMGSANISLSTFTLYSNQSTRSVSTFTTTPSTFSTTSGDSWRTAASSAWSITSSDSWRTAASSARSITFSERTTMSNGCRPDRTYPLSSSSGSFLYPNRGNANNASLRLPPPNVKLMTGIPRELRGAKTGKPVMGTRRKIALEAIHERPQHLTQYRQEAATSTTDLASQALGQLDAEIGQELSGQAQRQDDGDPPKTSKVQINTFARMLSVVLRR